MNDPIRVLIADDHVLIRHGLVAILQHEAADGFTVVGEAHNGQQAVEMARRLSPDVIIMDIQMPVLNGIAATQRILSENPRARVVMLTMHRDDANVFAAIEAGAQGYFLKDGDGRALVSGLRAVHLGEALMDAPVAARVLEAFRQRREPGADEVLETLTPGEMDVLLLIARGEDNAVIGDRLALAPGTIGNRLSSIYGKLRVNNRTQAALEALRRGWTTLDDG